MKQYLTQTILIGTNVYVVCVWFGSIDDHDCRQQHSSS